MPSGRADNFKFRGAAFSGGNPEWRTHENDNAVNGNQMAIAAHALQGRHAGGIVGPGKDLPSGRPIRPIELGLVASPKRAGVDLQ